LAAAFASRDKNAPMPIMKIGAIASNGTIGIGFT